MLAILNLVLTMPSSSIGSTDISIGNAKSVLAILNVVLNVVLAVRISTGNNKSSIGNTKIGTGNAKQSTGDTKHSIDNDNVKRSTGILGIALAHPNLGLAKLRLAVQKKRYWQLNM